MRATTSPRAVNVADYRCYVCDTRDQDDYELNEIGDVVAVRRPIGWSKDTNGCDRCPRHNMSNPTFATLGDVLRAKMEKS